MTPEMSVEAVNSWIFLAIKLASNQAPATQDGISTIADGINHAVPTHHELQIAFGWLLTKGLIMREAKGFRLTEKGLILFNEATIKTDKLLETWASLKETFQNQLAEADHQ